MEALTSDRHRKTTSVLRGGLYSVKPAFVTRLRSLEDRAVAKGVRPDTLTVSAVGISVATAAALIAGGQWPLLWLVVPPLCLARMACNALDGSIARRTNRAGRRGMVLNELGDRAGDAVTFLALAPATGLPLALATTLVAMAVSFIALTGEAAMGQRAGTGPMGKPDRVAVLAVGSVAAVFAGTTALAVAAWIIIVLGVFTMVRRTVRLWRDAAVAR